MATKWQVLYYETSNGICPIRDFINSRKTREQAKLLAFISYLQDQGPTLPRPYADLLADGIHELRVRLTGDQVRILYFFCYRRYIVLTHAFTKTTAKVPPAELEEAKRYRSDFLSRYRESDMEELYDDI